MSNAKKCDRCGKFYEAANNNKFVRYGTEALNGLLVDGVIFDLCPICAIDFRHWLNKYKEVLVDDED